MSRHKKSASMGSVPNQLHQSPSSVSITSESLRAYDEKLFEFTKVSPEAFASEITLLYFNIFKRITPEELSSCSFASNLQKEEKAPNVVAFTRCFNQTNFWVQRVILDTKRLRNRIDVVSHFVKIAKRLFELKNLHAVKAILAALSSQPIYRLDRTWSHVQKRDIDSLGKLQDLFDEKNNWTKLREYLSSVKNPCMPYLGMYLNDITYIDVAHPHSGGMESNERRTKMNNILRMISEFQRSSFDHLSSHEYVRAHLVDKKYRYIEELTKFVEEELHQTSLKLESDKYTVSSQSLQANASINGTTPVRQHHSHAKHHNHHVHVRRGKSFSDTLQKEKELALEKNPIGDFQDATPGDTSSDSSSLKARICDTTFTVTPTLESAVKFKKVRDQGQPRKGQHYQHCYLQLQPPLLSWCLPVNQLRDVGMRTGFATPKKTAFRQKPDKVMEITADSMVTVSDRKPNSFLVQESERGDTIKFVTASQEESQRWTDELSETIKRLKNKDLIRF